MEIYPINYTDPIYCARMKNEMENYLKFKTLGATNMFKPYRQDNAYWRQKELATRRLLFKQRKFVELLDHIEYNQNKINRKKDTQNKNLDKFLASYGSSVNKSQQQQGGSIDQDNKQEEKDEVLVVTAGSNSTSRMGSSINNNKNNNNNNPKSINSSNNKSKFKSSAHINNQIMDNRLPQLKFHDSDTKKDIKSRISRCIKKCEQGSWKKGVQALDSSKPVDLHVNNNFAKLSGKFGQEKLLDYQMAKLKLKLETTTTANIIAKSDSSASAGMDGIVRPLKINRLENCLQVGVRGYEPTFFSLFRHV